MAENEIEKIAPPVQTRRSNQMDSARLQIFATLIQMQSFAIHRFRCLESDYPAQSLGQQIVGAR